MRKVIAAAFISLDGVMQAPGGPDEDTAGGFAHGGWVFHYLDEATQEVLGKTLFSSYDLLLGRNTYDIFAAYWPYAGDDDPIGAKFNAATKYVATASPGPLDWKNSVVIGDDGAAEVARLKQQDGPDLLLQGSGEFIQALLADDLIDEFRLMIFPLLLGAGKRLFADGARPAALKLVDTKTSPSGVIMSTYRRGGEIETGSFAQAEPSDAEIERQRRMRRETA